MQALKEEINQSVVGRQLEYRVAFPARAYGECQIKVNTVTVSRKQLRNTKDSQKGS